VNPFGRMCGTIYPGSCIRLVLGFGIKTGYDNKSYPSPKLTPSRRLMIESLSSFVLNPCLTFLNSACTLFISNQVYSLVRVYHRVILLWFCMYFPILFCYNSTLVSTNPTQYPTWCPFTSEPWCSDLTRDFVYQSCSSHPSDYHLPSCQWSL
jgi:hypothetical protein